MRLILTLEYDGTPFRGWAAQPGLPTVEGALRVALGETFASVENLAGNADEVHVDSGSRGLLTRYLVHLEREVPLRLRHARERESDPPDVVL